MMRKNAQVTVVLALTRYCVQMNCTRTRTTAAARMVVITLVRCRSVNVTAIHASQSCHCMRAVYLPGGCAGPILDSEAFCPTVQPGLQLYWLCSIHHG